MCQKSSLPFGKGGVRLMIQEDSVYKIGTLTRVHALRGEVSLSFTDDVWDRADASFLILRIDGILVPFQLEEYRFRSDSVALIKFLHIDDADAAQELVGSDVYFPFDLTPEEDPEEYTWKHFTGFTVSDEVLGDLGTVVEVEDSTANVLFCVEGRYGDLMLPAVEEFILDIDHSGRHVSMRLPEGLVDLN